MRVIVLLEIHLKNWKSWEGTSISCHADKAGRDVAAL